MARGDSLFKSFVGTEPRGTWGWRFHQYIVEDGMFYEEGYIEGQIQSANVEEGGKIRVVTREWVKLDASV